MSLETIAYLHTEDGTRLRVRRWDSRGSRKTGKGIVQPANLERLGEEGWHVLATWSGQHPEGKHRLRSHAEVIHEGLGRASVVADARVAYIFLEERADLTPEEAKSAALAAGHEGVAVTEMTPALFKEEV